MKRKRAAKLFEVNGVVIGSVGLVEEKFHFKTFLKKHKLIPDCENILESMVQFLEWKKKRVGDDGKIENEYILGIYGSVFSVCELLVEKVADYAAIGAGMDFALAALYLGHTAEKAIETAIELSVWCEGPVKVIKRAA